MQTDKEVVVNKKAYKVISMPPTLALEYYLTLQKYALGPVGELIDKAAPTVTEADAKLNKQALFEKFMGSTVNVGAALGKLGATIEPKLLTELFKGLVINGARKKDGGEFIFEEEFNGDIQTLFGLVGEVVSHNYPNFFGMLLDLIKGEATVSTTEK